MEVKQGTKKAILEAMLDGKTDWLMMKSSPFLQNLSVGLQLIQSSIKWDKGMNREAREMTLSLSLQAMFTNKTATVAEGKVTFYTPTSTVVTGMYTEITVWITNQDSV